MARALPVLTEHLLLPVGVHELTLSEVEALFANPSQSPRRQALFAKLAEYLREVKVAGWNVQVIVDGSFVMPSVTAPEDIDVLLVLPDGWDMTATVRPFEYDLIARRRTRRRYGFDVFAARNGSQEERAMIEFFEQVNTKWNAPLGLPAGLKKGIVRITP